MTKPCVFYFSFAVPGTEDEEGCPIIRDYGFNITPEGAQKCIDSVRDPLDDIPTWEDFDKGLYDEYVDEIEREYGVHDMGGGSEDECEAIGFNTYEVEQDRILELMNKWRDIFVSLAGEENVTQVVEITGVGQSGYETYLEIEKKVRDIK